MIKNFEFHEILKRVLINDPDEKTKYTDDYRLLYVTMETYPKMHCADLHLIIHLKHTKSSISWFIKLSCMKYSSLFCYKYYMYHTFLEPLPGWNQITNLKIVTTGLKFNIKLNIFNFFA